MNPESIGILMGTICGAVIGIERQWSGHASGPRPHFAGVRTQTILGGLGAVSGWLWTHNAQAISVITCAACVAIVAIAYAAVSRRDADATTEVAALEVIAAGWLAGSGTWALASGMTVVTAVLLMEKSRLHTWVSRISDTGLRASFRFALMALVILPLLPEGPFGPMAIRPQELWIVVLLFSGISFAAYLVRSFLGSMGYLWAGALGGLISSTNVTLSFARLSRKNSGTARLLALGVVAACTMLNLRVLAAVAILRPGLAWPVAQLVLPGTAIGVVYIWLALKRSGPPAADLPPDPSPLQFRAALQMALLLQAMLLITSAAYGRWGSSGLMVSGAILGFTDVDALVASIAKIGTSTEVKTATVALGVGILANTLLKIGIALTFGESRFRVWAAAGLMLVGSAVAAGCWLLAQAA